mmetsp:Transcript_6800/g.16349  ORF Transcript_6800/g.16349 Transcript_6800/m.16349 type:complete len:85 (+) Transcript_6800:1384-1638(+)
MSNVLLSVSRFGLVCAQPLTSNGCGGKGVLIEIILLDPVVLELIRISIVCRNSTTATTSTSARQDNNNNKNNTTSNTSRDVRCF